MSQYNKQQKNPSKYTMVSCSSCMVGDHKFTDECKLCKNSKYGMIADNLFFYWSRDISLSAKKKKHAQRIAYTLVMLSGLLLIVLSLVIWGWSVFQYIKTFDYFPSGIWENSYYGMIWFALIVLCVLFFRFKLHSESNKKVYKRSSKLKRKQQFVPDDITKLPRIEISSAFNHDSHAALFDAWELAFRLGHSKVTPVHLLAVLPQFHQISIVLARLGLSSTDLRNKFTKLLAQLESQQNTKPEISDATYKSILLAYYHAYSYKLESVSVVDLLHALTLGDHEQKYKDLIIRLFDELEISEETLENVIEWMRIKQQLYERYVRFKSLARFKPKGAVNRAMTSIATKMLDAFSQDLTRAAAYEYLMPLIGREKEIQEIFRVIEGTNKSILIVGNKGIGKGALIEGIAQMMVTEDVPDVLQDKRLVDISLPHLIGGVDPAQAQDRLLRVLGESIQSGNIVLSIKNIEHMLGITTGGASSLDLSQVLVNSLKNRRIFAIATTDPQSYSKYIENSAIGEAFNVVRVDEMSINEAIQVLESQVGHIEAQQQVYFSYNALEQAVKLSNRYIHDQFLPEKAIDIIQEVSVYVKNNKQDSNLVMGEDVAQIIANRTRIPVTSLTENESQKLLQMESLIHGRIIGQEEAVKVVSSSLRRARTELRDGKRPIANLLFLGPTGVGKTELSKTLADIYFGREDAMLRFDMSEYQEKSSLDRLIGRLDEPGHLTDAVRRNPFSLLLFDEIEKAHPDILNIFLQMMDDGRLTDGMGRTVDFTNTIIIATSNAGTEYIQDEIKKDTPIETITDVLMRDKLREHYRPEFLNRFDNIVVFKPLTYENIIEIARLLLKKVAQRLEQKHITFKYSDAALAEIAKAGYDPQFGARPLRRVIQEQIDNKLAEYLLSGQLGKRDTVEFDVGGKFYIKKQ